MKNFNIFKDQLEQMMDTDYRVFVEVLISIETGLNNYNALRLRYDSFIDDDCITLIHQHISDN